MRDIAFVTYQQQPALTDDDRLVFAPLQQAGVTPRAVVWDDPMVRWQDFAAVVIRSTWDYHRRPDEFAAWLDRLDQIGVALWNPPELVRWNMHKGYLRDLAARHVPLAPTVWLQRGSSADLATLLQQQEWEQAVIKPAIAASAFRTLRTSIQRAVDDQAQVNDLLHHSDVLIQRNIDAIEARGEWSLMFLGGCFSHGVLKRPAAGDFRVQSEFGGSTSAAQPSSDLIAQAQRILDGLDQPWLYARVDGVDVDATFVLMELELIEPFLFLGRDPQAAQHFADAILERTQLH